MNRVMETGVLAAALASSSSFAAGDVVIDWNNVWIETIRATGGPPCPIARAGAILHAAMFDAINSVDHEFESYHMHLAVPRGTSKDAAGATAAHAVLSELYDSPELQELFDDQLAAHLDAIPDGPAKTDGINLGSTCARGILELRANDGSDAPPLYRFGTNPGDWIQTPPDFSAPASPHWPNVTPWTMTSGDQFRPIGPAGYTTMAALLASPEYAATYDDVRILGDIDSKVRTEYETETARFWANDRNGTYKPPGHLNVITQIIAADRGQTLEQNARLFALVNIAMADAGIVAWDAKYATPIDLWRPFTGITLGDTDGNPTTVADPTWVPLSHDPDVNGFTPPFPAYVSGHATFGAVHAGILTDYFGTDAVTFTTGSDDTPGVFRTYESLAAAALENGRSRIFLGVHWQLDADDGYLAGSALAKHVADNFLRPLGDLNGDDIVDGADLGTLLLAWGACPRGGSCPTDLDGSGEIDGADLGILLLNWTG